MASTESHKDNLFSALDIKDIEIFLRLGCTQTERSTAQRVLVSARFRFESPPAGCKTDKLTDTICYAALTKAITHLSHDREFQLIESFAQVCYEHLKKTLTPSTRLQITVNKVRPPVVELKGGAHFTLGDF